MESDRPAYVTAMLTSAAYPFPVRDEEIELRQTHISYVHLTQEFVYKTKKPVDFGFINQLSAETRRLNCEREVKLNSRLAPSIYISVVPIVLLPSGQIQVEPANEDLPNSEIIEWAVKMKRLPEDSTLQKFLTGSEERSTEVMSNLPVDLANRLVAFHRDCAKVQNDPGFAGIGPVRAWWDRETREIEEFLGVTFDEEIQARLNRFTDSTLDRIEGILLNRLESGLVVEGHGDLHCDHVYLVKSSASENNGHAEILIVDCIEFNDWFQFRFLDVGYEIAFLAMDLTFQGWENLADEFVAHYIISSGDQTLSALQPLHRMFRAFVRAKIFSITAMDRNIDHDARDSAIVEAKKYSELADSFATRFQAQKFIVLSGVSGSGKSLLGAAVAARIGAVWLNSDVIRKELAGIPVTEVLDAGHYDLDMNVEVYQTLRERTQKYLREGFTVVADATHLQKVQRAETLQAAQHTKAETLLVGLRISEPLASQRVTDRARQTGNISDATVEIVRDQLMQREEIEPDEANSYLILDSGDSFKYNLEEILKSIEVR
ncbi:MAG: AAA family ATPase [Chloroflexota bacterium]|nr:AAA family ATPase [Chloroflexota bacterium]